MARNQNPPSSENPEGASQDAPSPEAPAAAPIDPLALMAALKALPHDQLASLLNHAGVTPTTIGMTPDVILQLVQTMGGVQAATIRETLRAERKENPNYPEISVFNPRGVFDKDGRALPPKVKFRRPTICCGVRLGGELETVEEIELCNRLTGQRHAHNGDWTAEVMNEGRPREELHIKFPSFTMDNRAENPPFTHILIALLDGEEAINPMTMLKRIEMLEKQIRASGQQPAA